MSLSQTSKFEWNRIFKLIVDTAKKQMWNLPKIPF